MSGTLPPRTLFLLLLSATPAGCTEAPVCPPGVSNPVCELPADEHAPTDTPDGVPSPLGGVYDDQGEAPLDDHVRGLLGLPTRQRERLEEQVRAIYSPSSPEFRRYLSVAEWMAEHAPTADDYALLRAWLELMDLRVTFQASNRLLVAFSGTVADFNAAFGVTLRRCLRKNPLAGAPPVVVYCAHESPTVPKFVADRTSGLLTADLPAATGTLPGEAGSVIVDPPGPDAYTPPDIARAYGLEPLEQGGLRGQDVVLGVLAAATFHAIDLQTFWASVGITRELPVRIPTMEPVVTRITETILDVQWASALAPAATVRVYEGPDARNTSLLFTFNEAIARNEVDVLTTSFAHREDAEPKALRHQYDHSALQAAALGITLLSASGDSARPDTPCSSPYVTCVGGTQLVLTDEGKVQLEFAMSHSGSGDSRSFPRPYWQEGITPGPTRAVCDLALNAAADTPYWVRRFGEWRHLSGTSFAAPAFAGMVAVITSQRRARGLPRPGWLNPALYLEPGVQATFRDITQGGTDLFDAGPGWDYPTGWGAPNASLLADALP